MAEPKKHYASLSSGIGVVSLIASIFLGRDILTLSILGTVAALCFLHAGYYSPWVLSARAQSPFRITRRIFVSAVVILLCFAGWYMLKHRLEVEIEDARQSKDAFNAIPGTAFIAQTLDRAIMWSHYSCPQGSCITPIGLAFTLTVTNRKHTKAMISNFYLQILDSDDKGNDIYELPHGGPILWGLLSDINKSTIGVVNLTDGLLEDKLANISLEPGKAVSGWVLAEQPFDFTNTSIKKLRIHIRDTAGSDFTQDVDWQTGTQEHSILSI